MLASSKFLLSALLVFVTPTRSLELTRSGAKLLPEQCPASAPLTGGYDEGSLYTFCAGILFKYTPSTDHEGDTFTNLGAPPVGNSSYQVTREGGQFVKLLSLAADVESPTTPVWRFNRANLTWVKVAELPMNPNETLQANPVWDGTDSVYFMDAPSIRKLSISDQTFRNAGQLPVKGGACIWVPKQRSVYVFGSAAEVLEQRFQLVWRYQPDTETTKVVANLPIMPGSYPRPGIVRVKDVVYLFYRDETPQLRVVRFEPDTNNFTNLAPVQVGESGFSSQFGVAYAENLNRLYFFENVGGEQVILYMDLTNEATPPRGCTQVDKYGVAYEAPAGHAARRPCPGVSNGTATWFCDGLNSTFHGEHPDYSSCTSMWIDEVQDKIDAGEPLTFTDASETLRSIKQNLLESSDLENSITYFGHEIKSLFQIGETILELVDNKTHVMEVEQLTATTFTVFDQVLQNAGPWEELTSDDRAEVGTAFIQASDNSALRLGHAQEVEANFSGYRMVFNDSGVFQILSGTEPVDQSHGATGTKITFPQEHGKADSYIEIPSDWSDYFETAKYVALAGLQLSQGLATRLFPPNNSNTGTRILNGPLMSFTFSNPTDFSQALPTNVNFTRKGVRIIFRHSVPATKCGGRAPLRRRLHEGESPTAIMDTGVCMYWNVDQQAWSSDGCRLVSSDSEQTVCECDHLTAFSVLMDLHEYVGKSFVLEATTWVLCSLSIVCLLVTIFVLLQSRYGRRPLLKKHPRHDLTLGLCISLFVANVLILTTMDRHYLHLSDAVCTGFAIVLHYVLLCAFAWMTLEGVLIARLILIGVYVTAREYARLELVGALAVPALIVGVTSGLNFYQDDCGYGNDAFCWLNGSYLWSFSYIVSLVIIFNTSVLVMSIRNSYLRKVRRNRRVGSQVATSTSFWIRGALSLTVIMGLTWVSGFFLLVDNVVVANLAAYLFTVLNASQGIFIFIFHVVLSEEVQSRFRVPNFLSKSTTWISTEKEPREVQSPLNEHQHGETVSLRQYARIVSMGIQNLRRKTFIEEERSEVQM